MDILGERTISRDKALTIKNLDKLIYKTLTTTSDF